MKRSIVLLVCTFLFSATYCQTSKNVLKRLIVDVENMRNECSTFLLAKVEVDKKGCIDSVRFMTGGNTLFAQNIRNGFYSLKRKGEKINKKPLIVFFVYHNITEGEGFDATKCIKDMSYYPLFAKQEQSDCIFIGPVVFVSSIR
jgi:hypothetical protein